MFQYEECGKECYRGNQYAFFKIFLLLSLHTLKKLLYKIHSIAKHIFDL